MVTDAGGLMLSLAAKSFGAQYAHVPQLAGLGSDGTWLQTVLCRGQHMSANAFRVGTTQRDGSNMPV